jgi:protein-tyrosine phosphatase
MRSILFVCTANICRSPIAEAVMRKHLADRGGLERFELDSAGTHDMHVGKPPSPLAIERAGLRGYELAHLVARQVSAGDFEHFDLLLGMSSEHVAGLRKIAPTRCKHKIELFLEYGERFHGKSIPDPYGGTAKDYDTVIDMIEDGCVGLVEVLVR